MFEVLVVKPRAPGEVFAIEDITNVSTYDENAKKDHNDKNQHTFSVVAHSFGSSTWVTEADRSLWIPGQLGCRSETLSENKQ